ncbi:MAG: hypothetical protein R2853_13505 [Thermomicrobiales bacterium]
MVIAKRIAIAMKAAYGCDGISLRQHNEPYRPHLPHPDFYRVVGFGEIALVGSPTNPPESEDVDEVSVMPVGAAEDLFRVWRRPDIAALYRLEARSRQSG